MLTGKYIDVPAGIDDYVMDRENRERAVGKHGESEREDGYKGVGDDFVSVQDG